MGVATTLGWGLIGPKKLSVSHFACHYISSQSSQDEIVRDVEEVFARGFEPVAEEEEAMSLEDKFALRQMEESIRWDAAVGRYRVGLPWNNGREAAAKALNHLDSDKMALDRLERLARKMRREPERCRITFETMAKFDEKGRVKRVDPAAHAAHPPGKPKWSIPIHVADKPGKPGQVRVCHDCRAPVGGTCLNDFLLDGPPLACDIRASS